MNSKKNFSLQTLLISVLINGGLLSAFYYFGQAYLTENNLLPMFWGIGAGATLLLWLLISAVGGSKISAGTEKKPAKAEPKAKGPSQEEIQAPAIQMLAILQRKGRLIDFLQEDIAEYDDAQIGAAVRNIHEGCRRALAEYVTLTPIFKQEEGTEVTVQQGFNANEIRLIGNVVGDPPFKGALQHKGWRVAKIDLPKLTQEVEQTKILAAAEVEVS